MFRKRSKESNTVAESEVPEMTTRKQVLLRCLRMVLLALVAVAVIAVLHFLIYYTSSYIRYNVIKP